MADFSITNAIASTVKLLSRAEIDADAWDHQARSSPLFRPYYLHYYLDKVCADWMALVWPNYEVIWPLPIKKRPRRVYQPFLTQQLGPIGTRSLTADEFTAAWNLLKRSFFSVEVKFNHGIRELPVQSVTNQNLELSLIQPYDEIAKGYKRTARGNANKAQRAGVECAVGRLTYQQSIAFFQQHRGPEHKVLSAAFYSELQALAHELNRRDELEVWSCHSAREVVASALIVRIDNWLVAALWSASLAGQQVGAAHTLFDRIIQLHAGSNKTLDFEGSNHTGTAFFYQSFGGTPHLYLRATAAPTLRGILASLQLWP